MTDPTPQPTPQPARGPAADVLVRADAWFLAHGLSYFVPEVRAQVRAGLHPRRTLPLALVVVLVSATVAGLLTWATGQPTTAPAVLLSLGAVAVVGYALTVLRALPIITWALGRTFGSLRSLLPMMTRALPLLLVFVTFLFINAEVWQLAASLATSTLWLVVLLFVALATGFLLVRLPEEVDQVDDAVDAAFLRRACAATPLERTCEDLLADRAAPDPVARAQVEGYERWNLVLVLLVIQAVQVILLAGTVLVFFLVFGTLAMNAEVQAAWTGLDPAALQALPGLGNVSVPLFQVSLFLAAFSSLYLTVSTVTDETYREHFFSSVLRELQTAVGMRAVYLTVREQRSGRTG